MINLNSDKVQVMVAVKLKSGMWQLTKLNTYLDGDGAKLLPLEANCPVYNEERSCKIKFIKANKRGKWFYEEV